MPPRVYRKPMGTVEWINLIWVFFMSGENPGYLISTAGFHETRSYIAISLAYYGLNPLLQSTKVWGTIKLWAEWRISHLCPKVFFPRGHDVEVECFNDFNVHIVCVCVFESSSCLKIQEFKWMNLGGGFKYLLFYPCLGAHDPIWRYFCRWVETCNHQA